MSLVPTEVTSKSSCRMSNMDLQLAREAAGLSLEQAAIAIGISRDRLAAIEADGGWDGLEFGSPQNPLVRAFDRVYGLAAGLRRCRECGCTDEDCAECFARTGRPC